MKYLFPVLIALLGLGACITTPPLAVNEGVFATAPMSAAAGKGAVGKRVKWGGIIISVAPGQKETCLEILSRPLDSDGEPLAVDATEGRFIACSPPLNDPAALPLGRRLTVAGTVQSPVACKIGNYEGRCPRVDIEALHLWPKRQYTPWPCYYDPFWGPYRYPYPRGYPYFP